MRNFLTLIFVLAGVYLAGIPQTPAIIRSTGIPPLVDIPIGDVNPGTSGPGLTDRDADHGVVAMNSQRDIAVAFHTSRNELGTIGTRKQVEVAYYDYKSNETWEHVGTFIVGTLDWDPLTLNQNFVKCERPDIVAVDDKFFVVWTRRYHSSTHQNEPAVLECAWLEETGNPSDPVKVWSNSIGGFGLGFELDAHGGNSEFFVRECAGVVDAVALTDPVEQYKVAVVYPHQFDFSAPPADETRKFEMRVVTCTFDDSLKAISKVGPQTLHSSFAFNGAGAPPGILAPGMILPDLAPSSEYLAFWAVHERQQLVDLGSGEKPDGRIKLEYWQNVGGTWTLEAAKTFKSSPGETYWRRRPMVSSFPDGSQKHLATLAFFELNSNPGPGENQTANVRFEEWEYANGSLVAHPVTVVDWPNTSTHWDDRPVPLQGRTSPYVRRCFATRDDITTSADTIKLMSFDDITTPAQLNSMDYTDYIGLKRPSAAYHFEPNHPYPDYIAYTWEKTETLTSPKRVWIGVK